ncbi:AarF/ABC1/UbiB kinase family protein, partial [archaeon]|nr:AarF/ABC1/UbiB kinase family protein [archaeon]
KINQKIFDPEQIISEFEEYTEFELDYHHEARNVEIIYNNFKNHKTKIPKVYRDLCTDKILVMEYIDGHNLLDSILTKKGKKEVSKKIADTLQKQIFVDGVFHADPHPGNIFVTKGNNIAFIDFGIVGFIGDELRENLISLLIAAIAKDVEGIAAVITSIGATKEDINIDDFRRDLSQCMSIYYETEIKEIKMDEIIHSVITICNDYKIILPKNFVLLAKCIITTESVIYDFDPNFNPIKNAKPFVMDLIKSRYNPKKIFKNLGTNVRNVKNFITKIPKISNDLVTGLEKGEYYVKKIHKDMNILNNEIDRSSKRVSLAMIATALIIASAFLVTLDQTKIMGISLISFIGFSLASLFLFFLLISMIHQN